MTTAQFLKRFFESCSVAIYDYCDDEKVYHNAQRFKPIMKWKFDNRFRAYGYGIMGSDGRFIYGEEFKRCPLEVIQGDALSLDLNRITFGPYTVREAYGEERSSWLRSGF